MQMDAIALRDSSALGSVGFWDLKAAGQFDKGRLVDPVANQSWALKGSADFNSDGKKDLAWQNSGTGEVGIWYSNDAGFDKVALRTNPGTQWELAGVGDLTNDGSNDLFFINRATGEAGAWVFNGTQRNDAIATFSITKDSEALTTNFQGWDFGGIGDFTGDGKSDILWQNGTQIGVWEMNGDQFVAATSKTNATIAGWTLAGTGDFDANGKADLLFHNQSTGEIGFWKVKNGVEFDGAVAIGSAPTSWKPVSSIDTSIPNPLAEYEGISQSIQLNFAPDAPLDMGTKNAMISLAGIVEQAIGGRTNLPLDFTLKFAIDQSAVENLEGILTGLS